jgi:hypothetical protein
LTFFRRGQEASDKTVEVAPLPISAVSPELRAREARLGLAHLLTVEIDPSADPVFQFVLPVGEHHVAVGDDTHPLPPTHTLLTLAYGAANLLTEHLKIRTGESAAFLVGFKLADSGAWPIMSGRVVDGGRRPDRFRVVLQGNLNMESAVNPDGSFSFGRVPPGHTYRVALIPPHPAVDAQMISVGVYDRSDIQIVVPRTMEVRGRVIAGGPPPVQVQPLPGLTLTLHKWNPRPVPAGAGPAREFNAVRPAVAIWRYATFEIKPAPDGYFKVELPVGNTPVTGNLSIDGFYPEGTLRVESALYGLANIEGSPFTIEEGDPSEIRIVLNSGSTVLASVEGRVTGLPAGKVAGQVALIPIVGQQRNEAALGNDGAFRMERVPPGAYAVSLQTAGQSGQAGWTPSVLTVSGANVRLDIVVRPGPAAPEAGREELPTFITANVVIHDGLRTSGAASEAVAVANLRTINTAQVSFLSASGGNYGDLEKLVDAGLLDDRFAKKSIGGYTLSVIAQGSDYLAMAVPTSPESGRYAFYSTPDGVVRYSTAEALAPPGEQGRPVQ